MKEYKSYFVTAWRNHINWMQMLKWFNLYGQVWLESLYCMLKLYLISVSEIIQNWSSDIPFIF